MDLKNENLEDAQKTQSLQNVQNQGDINDFVKKRVRITRKSLNIQAFIGLFIFGWLMKMNYDDLGEKGFGWAFLIIMAIIFAIGKQAEPKAFFVLPVIYIAAWIHTNILLSNLEKQARDAFSDLNLRNKDNDTQI